MESNAFSRLKQQRVGDSPFRICCRMSSWVERWHQRMKCLSDMQFGCDVGTPSHEQGLKMIEEYNLEALGDD